MNSEFRHFITAMRLCYRKLSIKQQSCDVSRYYRQFFRILQVIVSIKSHAFFLKRGNGESADRFYKKFKIRIFNPFNEQKYILKQFI